MRCISIGDTQSRQVEGAVVEDCLFQQTTADTDCISLLNNNGKIHNSTLLVVEGGTGVPINAATALSVSAVGNRYNNAAASATGLGVNVTNVGAGEADKVTLDIAAADALAAKTASEAIATDLADGTGRLDLALDQIAADVAGLDGEAMPVVPPALTDYQQRNVSVTLPTTPPTGYGTSTFDPTTQEVTPTAASKTGYALSTAGLAAVWNTLTAGMTTAGSIGKWLADKTGYSLLGTSGGVGPRVNVSHEPVYVTAPKNGTARLCQRVLLDGANITQSAIATITYSVFLLDDDVPDTRTAVAGRAAVSLTVVDVIFDALQTDSQASGYNFRHTPPVGASPAFTIAGRNYLVEYTITPNTGEPIILQFRVNVI